MRELNKNIFSNTEIAFNSKSKKQLKKAHFLFSVLKYPFISNMGIAFTRVALFLHLPVKSLIRNTIFSQFCGGESIVQSQKTIEELAKYDVGTILDYSVEGEEKKEVFDQTAEELLRTIDRASGDVKIPFCVFKPTGVGRLLIYQKVQAQEELTELEQKEYNQIVERYTMICQRAFDLNKPIFIDAEESWIQNTVDDLVYQMMKKFNKEKAVVFNTIQFYRKNSVELLKSEHERSIAEDFKYGVKMVRGAYMEKERERAMKMNYPSPINDTKEDTDGCYNNGLKYCVENFRGIALCAGTHNEESSFLLANLIKDKPEAKSSIYFAQLYGMSDHISFNLSDSEFKVVKYVPYGPVQYVMPYLFRRAEENTSIAGQTGRELGLIEKEIARREAIEKQ